MSNEEEKNVNISSSQPHKKTSSFLRKTLGALLLIAVIAGLSCAAYLYYTKHQSTQAETGLLPLQESIAELKTTTESQQATLNTLSENNASMKELVDNALPGLTNLKTPWLATQTQYLVSLANIALQQNRDTSAAIALLTLAKDNLATVTETPFENAKNAFSTDIDALKQVPVVDVPAIYQRLVALDQKINALTLKTQPTTQSTPATTEQANTWEKGLENTWQNLKQIVVVRHNNSGKMPLISPDQQVYVSQNLHTVLLQSMTALLQGETDIYQASLQHTIEWVNDYCVSENPATQSFIAELNTLKDTAIRPTLPDISHSVQAAEELKGGA